MKDAERTLLYLLKIFGPTGRQTLKDEMMERVATDGKVAHDLFATADVFHYPEDQSKFQGGMQVVYEVVQPADLILRCNSGSALWRCENTSNGKRTVFYTGGAWDLTGEGVFALNMPIISWRSYMGAPFAKGAYVLDAMGMQVCRAESGEDVQVTRPHDLGGDVLVRAWWVDGGE